MICETECAIPELAEVLGIIIPLFNLVKIIVPVGLVLFVMIDIIKAIISSEVDTKKLKKTIFSRLLAAIIVFLVPTIVHFILMNLPLPATNFYNCYKCIAK